MALFSRRKNKTLESRLTNFFWPKIGWKKSLLYYKKKIFRISDSPSHIAAGLACGISISMTPFIGFHLLLTALLCYIIRGNIVAGFIATLIGNPTTFPFIWLITYFIGAFLTGQSFDTKLLEGGMSFDIIQNSFFQMFLPMTLGGLTLAILVWPVIFYPSRKVIERYQARRKNKMKKRREFLQSIKNKIPEKLKTKPKFMTRNKDTKKQNKKDTP